MLNVKVTANSVYYHFSGLFTATLDLPDFRNFLRKTEGVCKDGPKEKKFGEKGTLILRYMVYETLFYNILQKEKIPLLKF